MKHEFNSVTDHCINCGVTREFCHDEAMALDNWRIKARDLYDLVSELAPHVPRTMPELHERTQRTLDDGVAWLDGKFIECDGDE